MSPLGATQSQGHHTSPLHTPQQPGWQYHPAHTLGSPKSFTKPPFPSWGAQEGREQGRSVSG